MAKRKAHRRGQHRVVIFPDKVLYEHYGKVQIMKFSSEEELARLFKRIRAASLDQIYDKRKKPTTPPSTPPTAAPATSSEPDDNKNAA